MKKHKKFLTVWMVISLSIGNWLMAEGAVEVKSAGGNVARITRSSESGMSLQIEMAAEGDSCESWVVAAPAGCDIRVSAARNLTGGAPAPTVRVGAMNSLRGLPVATVEVCSETPGRIEADLWFTGPVSQRSVPMPLPLTWARMAQRYVLGAEARIMTEMEPARSSGRTGQISYPEDVTQPENQADYLIITGTNFYNAARSDYLDGGAYTNALNQLAAWRADYNGFDVAVVSAGAGATDIAVKSIISNAYWRWNAPHMEDGRLGYVLLAGEERVVPMHSWGTYQSDVWYTWMDTGTLPDIFIGRFPFTNEYEATALVEKTIRYEEEPESGEWQQSIYFGTHENRSDFPVEDVFHSIFDERMRERELSGWNVFCDFPSTEVITNRMNQGLKLMVLFGGHTEPYNWGTGTFQSGPRGDYGEVALLNNSNRLPVILAHLAYSASTIADILMCYPHGGAVAYLGEHANVFPQIDREKNTLDAILDEWIYEVGQFAVAGDFVHGGSKTSLLTLGDPALNIGYGPKNYCDLTVSGTDLLVSYSQAENLLSCEGTVHNIGRMAAANIAVRWEARDAMGVLLWSEEQTIDALEAHAFNRRTATWTPPENFAGANVTLTVDPDNEIAESYEGNNQAGDYIHILPDLAFTFPGIAVSSVLRALIRNDSLTPTDDFQLKYLIMNEDGQVLAEESRTLALNGNERREEIFEYEVPVGAVYRVRCILDTEGQIAEWDENNNECEIPAFFFADLIPRIDSATYVADDGDWHISLSLGNTPVNGLPGGCATDIEVETTLHSAPGNPLRISHWIPALPPGRSTNWVEIISSPWSLDLAQIETYADPAHLILEYEKDNNMAATNIFKRGDLSVRSVSVIPQPDQMIATTVVSNGGQANISGFDVEFTMVNNQLQTQTYYQTWPESLSPGCTGVMEQAFDLTDPQAGGFLSLTVVANPSRQIPEISYDNNARSVAVGPFYEFDVSSRDVRLQGDPVTNIQVLAKNRINRHYSFGAIVRFSAIYESGADILGDQIAQFDSLHSSIIVNQPWDMGSPSGLKGIQVWVDPDNLGWEPREDNNIAVVFSTDLSIQERDVALYVSEVNGEVRVDVQAVVSNLGLLASAQVPVDIWLSYPDGRREKMERAIIPYLAAGGQARVNTHFNMDVRDRCARHGVEVVVDPEEYWLDGNRLNNQAIRRFALGLQHQVRELNTPALGSIQLDPKRGCQSNWLAWAERDSCVYLYDFDQDQTSLLGEPFTEEGPQVSLPWICWQADHAILGYDLRTQQTDCLVPDTTMEISFQMNYPYLIWSIYDQLRALDMSAGLTYAISDQLQENLFDSSEDRLVWVEEGTFLGYDFSSGQSRDWEAPYLPKFKIAGDYIVSQTLLTNTCMVNNWNNEDRITFGDIDPFSLWAVTKRHVAIIPYLSNECKVYDIRTGRLLKSLSLPNGEHASDLCMEGNLLFVFLPSGVYGFNVNCPTAELFSVVTNSVGRWTCAADKLITQQGAGFVAYLFEDMPPEAQASWRRGQWPGDLGAAPNNVPCVVLDGSASRDPDYYPQAMTYQWRKVRGKGGRLGNANQNTAYFLPPEDVTYPAKYEFELKVFDGEQWSAPCPVTVRLKEPVSSQPFVASKITP